jgi:hypothetical protein
MKKKGRQAKERGPQKKKASVAVKVVTIAAAPFFWNLVAFFKKADSKQ